MAAVPNPRQQRIADLIRQRGEARVAALADELRVSAMTVRRDLEALDTMGMVARVHGGAVARRDPSTNEPDFATKRRRNIAEKSVIARSAAQLVPSGAALGITGGTTTYEVAHHLEGSTDLTIVTNSLVVADHLESLDRRDLAVVLTGGARTRSNALVGPVAVATLRSFHLDLVIMGVHGMDPMRGFTSPNLLEAETNRAFIESAEHLMVVADHTKWGTAGLTTIAPLESAKTLVTDAGLPDEAAAVLEERVGAVVVAEAD